METRVILECPAFPEGRAFGIEHANRVFKIQGDRPDGWKLKEGQQFELDNNGVIIRTSDQTNPEPEGQKPDLSSGRPRRKNKVS